MAAKKAHPKKNAKKKEEIKLSHLPDVFEEPSAGSPEGENVVVTVVESETTVTAEPMAEDLPSPRPPRIVTEVEEEKEEVLDEEKVKQSDAETEPTFTVRQNGQTIEQELPSFFAEKKKEEAPTAQSPEQQILEAAVPQAFVGEANEVATEVKKERKGVLVTFFIILGMILLAGGIVGLFLVSSKKGETTIVSTPQVAATPAPTPSPKVIVSTETIASASAELKQSVKVNVLNGTAIKGLAAKEAAVLKQNGFTLGTVGNGNPALAGTIVVPTEKLVLGEEIKALLSDFTFTVTEDSKVSAITVTLGEPN